MGGLPSCMTFHSFMPRRNIAAGETERPNVVFDSAKTASISYGRRGGASQQRYEILVTEITLHTAGRPVPHAISQLFPPVQLTTDDRVRNTESSVFIRKPPFRHHVISRERLEYIRQFAGKSGNRELFHLKPASGQSTKASLTQKYRIPSQEWRAPDEVGLNLEVSASATQENEIRTAFTVALRQFEGLVPPDGRHRQHRPAVSSQRLRGQASVANGGGVFILIQNGSQEVSKDLLPISIPFTGDVFARRYHDRFLRGIIIQVKEADSRESS